MDGHSILWHETITQICCDMIVFLFAGYWTETEWESPSLLPPGLCSSAAAAGSRRQRFLPL